MHRLVLKGIDDKNTEKFRTIAVAIAGSDVKLPDPILVPDLMNEFIQWLHKTTDHPVIIAADAHFKLVSIHPFTDGNGRTARLLMNLLLIQAGYPPAIIDVKQRSTYISSIEKDQTTNNLDDFYTFIFEAIQHSLDKYLEAAKKTVS